MANGRIIFDVLTNKRDIHAMVPPPKKRKNTAMKILKREKCEKFYVCG